MSLLKKKILALIVGLFAFVGLFFVVDVRAGYVSGSITSIFSGYLTYTGQNFTIHGIGLTGLTSCGSGFDTISAYLSDTVDTGSLAGKPMLTGLVCNLMLGWTGTLPVLTTYENFSGDTLYLHAFIHDQTGNLKGYGRQSILFVGSGTTTQQWASIYTGMVYPFLTSSSIVNNLDLVNSGNVQNFSGLLLAQMSGTQELGRIVFGTGLDLTNSETQHFLSSELPTSVGMDQGEIWFDPGTGFVGKNATLTMYLPDYYSGELASLTKEDFYVREGSGGSLTGNDIISSVIPGTCIGTGNFACSVMITVDHFTMFGVKPILNYVHISSNVTGAVTSGTVVYLSFTGSESLTGVIVTIAGNTASVSGSGINWSASTTLVATGVSGTNIPFSIHFFDLSNNPGITITGTTDASYLQYSGTTSSDGDSEGGGGGSSSSQNKKDYCPDGDVSDTYYDGTCGLKKIEKIVTDAIKTGSIINSHFSKELNDAYLYAYQIGITTIPTIENANITGTLIRAHMAKMMVNYALNVMGSQVDTGRVCNFSDISSQTTEIQSYIRLACQLGIMGVGVSNFNPSGEVSRAQFATTLSRVLYGDLYNSSGSLYYIKHIKALKDRGIITLDNPKLKEQRGYVMLMLMRSK